MPLQPETLVGAYRIIAAIGAGGMGEVYRARDTTLNRDVALKVLPAAAALDPDRLQRLVREAQSLAALNHPHIAQIYGLVEGPAEAGPHNRAIVMELVEGEDLSTRIARGAVPLDEVLDIARQIAEALEAAHEVGIIHRDLKPANVKLRPDGTVKVLDFGLAKVLDRSGGAGRSGGEIANSPTFTSPAVTAAGMILGTAAYMSPEQARGKAVDKRADIWAFGVVLYEMLSGRFAFPGETVTDVIAAVVSRDPDWSALPSTTPPAMHHLLRRCLEKDHRLRLRDIGEARVALASPGAAVARSAFDAAPATLPRSRFGTLLPWAVALVAVVGGIGAWMLKPAPPAPLRRLELAMPANARNFELSPDGRTIAYFLGGRVWAMDLERLDSRDLAPAPLGQRSLVFWSPDSAFVGYNTGDGKLWTVPASGGAPLLLCTIPETRQLMGAAWRADGSIILAVWRGSLYQVPASGGEPRALVTIDPAKEVDFHLPVALPDGRVVVATHLAAKPGSATDTYLLEIVNGTERETIFGTGFLPVGYTDAGYLLLFRLDTSQGIWAFPYAGGGPLRVEDGFLLSAGGGFASATRRTDSLLHALASTAQPLRELVWVDRAGRVTGQVRAAGDVVSPALSPDSRRVAFAARVDGNLDIWVRDIQAGNESRVTFEAVDQSRPQWFSSRRLAYVESGGGIGGMRIVARSTDGSSDRLELMNGVTPAFSGDGRYLLFHLDERGSSHVRYTTIDADGKLSPPAPVFKSSPEPAVNGSMLSPDGRFLVCVERQASGNFEVVVTRFPSGEGRWQISAGGGRAPVWAANGELFFLAGPTDGAKQMMSTPTKLGDLPVFGTPVKLFDLTDDLDANYQLPMFDVTRDGKQLIMVRRTAGGPPAERWVLVQNWLTQTGSRR